MWRVCPSRRPLLNLHYLLRVSYGNEIPNKHRAPIRLVVTWKYGFKGVKSLASIDFTD
ncbi:MAG TPA: hypothetical protein DIU35_12670 [Candidatus Latescibacteria bacterium]|nr:hypothetical protein [Candidatus Latescibacterota bacterium]